MDTIPTGSENHPISIDSEPMGDNELMGDNEPMIIEKQGLSFGSRRIRKRARASTSEDDDSVSLISNGKRHHTVGAEDKPPVLQRVASPITITTFTPPSTLTEALMSLGFIQVPVNEDGRCCYTSMTKCVNLHTLLSGKGNGTEEAASIMNHLRDCVFTLMEEVDENPTLQKEIHQLLAIADPKTTVKTALKDMYSLFQQFEAGKVSSSNQKSWGNSSMFGLLGLVYGFKINRYVFSISSKKAIRDEGWGERRPASVEVVPDFQQFPEILHTLHSKIKGLQTESTYIIACDKLNQYQKGPQRPVNHFDVWVTEKQASEATQKLSALSPKSLKEYIPFGLDWFLNYIPSLSFNFVVPYFTRSKTKELKAEPASYDVPQIRQWLRC